MPEQEAKNQDARKPDLASPQTKIRFGLFEADLHAEELRKSGIRIKVQSQPFKVLSLMLEKPGEVVSREEIQQRLWGDQTTVDFDHGLGTAINKLREALGDSADNPRFIETLSRRGYRFIAPVTFPEFSQSRTINEAISASPRISTTMAPPIAGMPPADGPAIPSRWNASSSRSRIWRFAGLAFFCTLFALALGWWLWPANAALQTPQRISQITYSGRVFPGEPLQESLAATATDGSRIYFPQIENGRAVLAQSLIADGETSILQVPSEITAPSLGNISSDGSKLLVRNYLVPQAEQALWIVPTLGGTARSYSNIRAHDATWMPDGEHILYANGMDLFVANEDGTSSRKLATVPGRAFWLRWSPDGSRLRFTLIDPLNHTTSLWEISADGSHLHPLLPNWSNPASECCGSWTADGRYFVFQSAKTGMNNIWALRERSILSHFLKQQPLQITNGPLSYQAPITAATGDRMFFIGLDTRSILLQYVPGSGQFLAYGKALNAAQLVDFSRDGNSVAWINPQDSSLWASRVDGTQRLQLTSSPMEVFNMHWSPDGKRIALMGREPGKTWRLYIVDAQGGDMSPVLDEARNEADPDWSPDGKSLVFGRLPELMAEKSLPKSIYLLNLQTRKFSAIPGSEGLFSPRWSPDGRYIVAMPLAQNKLMLFDALTQTWKQLTDHPSHDPVWSRDGRSIYFHDFLDEEQTIYRVSVPDGHLQPVAGLQSLQPLDALDFRFAGLTPADLPLVSARISTANIYSLDLKQK